jgi:exosortase A-associated hydrolase 1
MTIDERVVPVALPGVPDAFGLLSLPTGTPGRWGVLILVGGPQYRVGAHRHFVTLARQLASAGIPALRFDHRGVGDTAVPLRGFDALDDDVAAGVDALTAAVPGLDGVVLWGLCDAASAALLYVARRSDARVRALALLNPWVRSPQGEARTRIQHYYWERLRSPEFWRKLLRGGVGLGALAGWWRLRRQARQTAGNTVASSDPFQVQMARGWQAFGGPILLQLSGKDHTAREFEDVAEVFPAWSGWHSRARLSLERFPEADHTLSQRATQDASTRSLVDWISTLK